MVALPLSAYVTWYRILHSARDFLKLLSFRKGCTGAKGEALPFDFSFRDCMDGGRAFLC